MAKSNKTSNRHAEFAKRQLRIRLKNLADILGAALKLTLFAFLGAVLLGVTYTLTYKRIQQNEIEAVQRNLQAVLASDRYDNDPYADRTRVDASVLLGSDEPVTVYRARLDGEPAAAVFRSVAPNGYNGAIKLLVGIYADGSISGVRVVAHKETPGLGDGIDERKSDWIFSFDQQSLAALGDDGWAVKKDGGEFDQFTGATITPRAVVQAVKNTLLYYQQNQTRVFE
jgi:electron transport complex protein RnfG